MRAHYRRTVNRRSARRPTETPTTAARRVDNRPTLTGTPDPSGTSPSPSSLPSLRFDISEAAQILRMSRALLYIRIQEGALHRQKDGARSYITRAELERYVHSCNETPAPDTVSVN